MSVHARPVVASPIAGDRALRRPVAGARAIRRSRAVRSARGRSRRSRQAGRRQGRARSRGLRYRDRDQILQEAAAFVAPRDVPARPRLCRQPADAGSDRRLAQGRRQGLDLGDGRTRRALRHRRRRRQGRRPGAQSCSSARRRPAIPRGVSNLAALSGGGGAPADPARRASCWRRPPRPMPKRSISSA